VTRSRVYFPKVPVHSLKNRFLVSYGFLRSTKGFPTTDWEQGGRRFPCSKSWGSWLSLPRFFSRKPLLLLGTFRGQKMSSSTFCAIFYLPKTFPGNAGPFLFCENKGVPSQPPNEHTKFWRLGKSFTQSREHSEIAVRHTEGLFKLGTSRLGERDCSANCTGALLSYKPLLSPEILLRGGATVFFSNPRWAARKSPSGFSPNTQSPPHNSGAITFLPNLILLPLYPIFCYPFRFFDKKVWKCSVFISLPHCCTVGDISPFPPPQHPFITFSLGALAFTQKSYKTLNFLSPFREVNRCFFHFFPLFFFLSPGKATTAQDESQSARGPRLASWGSSPLKVPGSGEGSFFRGLFFRIEGGDHQGRPPRDPRWWVCIWSGTPGKVGKDVGGFEFCTGKDTSQIAGPASGPHVAPPRFKFPCRGRIPRAPLPPPPDAVMRPLKWPPPCPNAENFFS